MFLKDCYSFKPVWEVIFVSPAYSFWPICEGPCYFDSCQVCLFLMMSFVALRALMESLTCVKVQDLLMVQLAQFGCGISGLQ